MTNADGAPPVRPPVPPAPAAAGAPVDERRSILDLFRN
jgi:hypothetical protein